MNYYGVLKEVPATVIKPLGFLKEFLMRQKTELSGHREKQGSTFNTPIWNDGVGTLLLRGCLAYDAETIMTPAEKSFAATPYKQSAYLPDGLLRLCLLFDDEGLKEKFLKNLDFLPSHPKEDRRLGYNYTDGNTEWPFAVVFHAIAAYCCATRDPRIIVPLKKHFNENCKRSDASSIPQSMGCQSRNVLCRGDN